MSRYRVPQGELPIIATFSSVSSVFVAGPNKGIFDGIIEPEGSVVNDIKDQWMELSVETLGMGVSRGKYVFD
jgi:hypothetical protein